jgi:uncharacterized protein
MGEREVVEVQLGRPLRSPADVVAVCHLGLPVVTRVPPLLDDGTPFPTLYWLACPLAVRRIARLEAAGGVAEMDRRALDDPAFGEALDAAHRAYAAERDAVLGAVTGPAPSGGVGGARAGVKCLHAHYAHHAVGGSNPVGEWTAAQIEPLDCSVPCVVEEDAGVRPNPVWREP